MEEPVNGDRVPLFVRIPADQARRLTESARRAGRAKQDLVADLIGQGLRAVPDLAATPTVTAVEVGMADVILTLDELVALLRVDEPEVQKRLAAGELPARRFGSEWRFSRAAVMRWLEGADRVERPTGFGRAPS
jgi:excisionase family DNA binding protein